MAMISACLELKLEYTRKKAAEADWDQIMPHQLLPSLCLSTFWGSQFYSQTKCGLLEEFSAMSALSLLSFRLSIFISVSTASWWRLPWAASTDRILVHQFSGPELVCPAMSRTRRGFSDLCSGIYCLFVSKVICNLTFLFGPTPSPVGRNGSQGDCYSLKLSLSMNSFADPYLSSLIKNNRGFDWYFKIVQVSS